MTGGMLAESRARRAVPNLTSLCFLRRPVWKQSSNCATEGSGGARVRTVDFATCFPELREFVDRAERGRNPALP
jgi:hypothetical protein